MSRRILSFILGVLLLGGGAVIVKADVTGSLDIDIALTPEGTQTEAVKFLFDLQSNLDINITLSGLTFGADIGFGTTGIEFAILSLSTNLGALSVFDEFVFATPFGCNFVQAPWGNFNNTPLEQMNETYPDHIFAVNGTDLDLSSTKSGGQCSGQYVFALEDGHGDANGPGFVKKRIQLELNIAGITLANLAIFEDVDFPDIQFTRAAPEGFTPRAHDHEHDHFIGPPGYEGNVNNFFREYLSGFGVYYLSGVDNEVDNQTPTFGFGDVITISGQTVSGITLSGSTALCVSGTNYIKKRSWAYEVNKACTARGGGRISGDLDTDANDNVTVVEDNQDRGAFPEPLEDGAKTPILFEEETLGIEGVEVGGVNIDVFTAWHPNDVNGFTTVIEASFTLLDLADVTVVLSSNNITSLSINQMVATVSSGNLHLVLTDNGGDLTIDRIVAVFSIVLNANQNPADLIVSVTTVDGVGLTSARLSLGISRGPITVDTTTVFAGAGELSWVGTSFGVSVDGVGGIVFGSELNYTPAGMGTISIELGFVF